VNVLVCTDFFLLFISVLSFRDIQLSEGYEWDSINNLIASQFHACPNTGPGFPMSYVVVFCVQLFEVRGGCSFCWCWWNCWQSLFIIMI